MRVNIKKGNGWRLFQTDMLHLHVFMKKHAGGFLETFGTFGGEIPACASLGASRSYLGMAVQIVVETAGDVAALGNDMHGGGQMFAYLGEE